MPAEKRRVVYNQQYSETEVTEFIKGFTQFEVGDCLKNTFTQGYCYYFSLILRERFPGGSIVYIPVMGHFSYLLQGNLYDITGKIETEEKYYDFENYPDYLQKQRIVRDCILKKEYDYASQKEI